MSATARIERPAAAAQTSTVLGRVVAQSSGRTVIASRLSAGLRMGDRLVFTGAPQVLAVVTGFEAPMTNPELSDDDVLFVEVRTVGLLRADGSAGRGAAQPSMGAECFRLPTSVETLDAGMGRAVVVGERGPGAPVPIDASAILGRTMTVTGDAGTGKSASLAVLMRALLVDGFPARLVMIDPEGTFSRSFGRAASVVDVSSSGLPISILTLEELETLLAKVGGPLSANERYALSRTRRALDGNVSVHELAKSALTLSDETTELRTDFLTLASRFEALIDDDRFAFICGKTASSMRPEHLLQTYFRLPDGQPPASVIQLHRLAPSLQAFVASVFARLGLAVSEQSGGAVPVVMFVDQTSLSTIDLSQVSSEAFGLVVAGQGLQPTADGLALLHRVRGAEAVNRLVPDADPLASEIRDVLPTLDGGEAILIDPDYPWPVRFRYTTLPEQAIPQKQRSACAQEPAAILETISASLLSTPTFS
ncbi:MAG: DUF87 domain-containing protein [Parvularculaceae bacterium]|nr:DUF87 domain-containing protein [Parvularculaceae bacterium]